MFNAKGNATHVLAVLELGPEPSEGDGGAGLKTWKISLCENMAACVT